MDDCLIVGGGVIGLSLAWELAGHGLAVHVIDRGAAGREASWAGAGILPPARNHPDAHPIEQLAALSFDLHFRWSEQLREATGIDTGLRRSGGVYLARDQQAAADLCRSAELWRVAGLAVEPLDAVALRTIEPGLADDVLAAAGRRAWWLPDESQIRNPWHLRALVAGCAGRGVRVTEGAAVEEFAVQGCSLREVRTAAGTFRAGTYCITSGAWSGGLAERLGAPLALQPVRGQIVLLACRQPVLRRIVNEGARYLVPRADGRVLVGSTEEHVGFDKRTTSAGVRGLLDLALSLAPRLADATVETAWAGLRPATADGLPYLGPVPGLGNAFMAAGHFRSGLSLSPATAVVMGELIRGQPPRIDLQPFALDRRTSGLGSNGR